MCIHPGKLFLVGLDPVLDGLLHLLVGLELVDGFDLVPEHLDLVLIGLGLAFESLDLVLGGLDLVLKGVDLAHQGPGLLVARGLVGHGWGDKICTKAKPLERFRMRLH